MNKLKYTLAGLLIGFCISQTTINLRTKSQIKTLESRCDMFERNLMRLQVGVMGIQTNVIGIQSNCDQMLPLFGMLTRTANSQTDFSVNLSDAAQRDRKFYAEQWWKVNDRLRKLEGLPPVPNDGVLR